MNGSALKKMKYVPWAGSHGHCFWDAHGIMLIDYLERQNNQQKDYADLLEQLKDTIKAKHPYLVTKINAFLSE